MLDQTTVVVPRETTPEDLLVVHTESYLDSLRVSSAMLVQNLQNIKIYLLFILRLIYLHQISYINVKISIERPKLS